MDTNLPHRDLKFIAGWFLDYDLPKHQRFFLRYFKTGIERHFLRYFLCFGDFTHFVDHTGCFCQRRWLLLLKHRFDKLQVLHDSAKNDMDFHQLAEIEMGKKGRGQNLSKPGVRTIYDTTYKRS